MAFERLDKKGEERQGIVVSGGYDELPETIKTKLDIFQVALGAHGLFGVARVTNVDDSGTERYGVFAAIGAKQYLLFEVTAEDFHETVTARAEDRQTKEIISRPFDAYDVGEAEAAGKVQIMLNMLEHFAKLEKVQQELAAQAEFSQMGDFSDGETGH